jgi:hypothetical protein
MKNRFWYLSLPRRLLVRGKDCSVTSAGSNTPFLARLDCYLAGAKDCIAGGSGSLALIG